MIKHYLKKILDKCFGWLGFKILNLDSYFEKTSFYNKKNFYESLSNSDLHPKVLKYFIDNQSQSNSQLCQDLFVTYLMENLDCKFENTFAEFGAADGLYLSNTKLLEEMGWKGILAEPARHFHFELRNNRKSQITFDAIGPNDKEEVMFIETENKSLSTMQKFVDRDLHTYRRRSGKNSQYTVRQISINTFLKHLNSKLTYLSIDTEGGEYEILLALDWDLFRPKFISVEHNFTNDNSKIEEYMEKMFYHRLYREFFSFDSFYVIDSAYAELKQKDLI
jgi:FkbM family methyltransferase